MITTTLNAIKEHKPCEEGWKKLLTHLGKTKADDEPLSLLTILESNGLDDALWCLRAVEGHDREIRLLACDFAERTLKFVPECENRPRKAIETSMMFANGLADEKELAAARDAAWDAARTAAWASRAAAWSAALAAARAADVWAAAASAAASAAARDASRAAVAAAQAARAALAAREALAASAAARDAAWDARDAAWTAWTASKAARDNERAEQEKMFRAWLESKQ